MLFPKFIPYTYTGNKIGVEGGEAMAIALKENNTLTSLNLRCMNKK